MDASPLCPTFDFHFLLYFFSFTIIAPHHRHHHLLPELGVINPAFMIAFVGMLCYKLKDVLLPPFKENYGEIQSLCLAPWRDEEEERQIRFSAWI